MPRGDGTGPDGFGAMTGRQAGYCAGYDRPGFANQGFGVRRGRGFRGPGGKRGFGFRRYYQPAYNNPPSVNEEEILKNDAEALKSELDAINKRLEELNEK